MSEETPGMVAQGGDEEDEGEELVQFQMRRTWESRYVHVMINFRFDTLQLVLPRIYVMLWPQLHAATRLYKNVSIKQWHSG